MLIYFYDTHFAFFFFLLFVFALISLCFMSLKHNLFPTLLNVKRFSFSKIYSLNIPSAICPGWQFRRQFTPIFCVIYCAPDQGASYNVTLKAECSGSLHICIRIKVSQWLWNVFIYNKCKHFLSSPRWSCFHKETNSLNVILWSGIIHTVRVGKIFTKAL